MAALEFRSAEYWNGFFRERNGRAFEWYGEWSDLAPLHGLLRPSARVLVVGAGNSELSRKIWDVTHDVANVDISPVVVDEMRARHARLAGMRWTTGDVRDLAAAGVAPAAADMVADKGMLDALCADDGAASTADAARMLDEVARALAPGGVYVLVSLLQTHVRAALLAALAGPAFRGARVDVHPFRPRDDVSPLCPFLVSVTLPTPDAPGLEAAEAARFHFHGLGPTPGAAPPAPLRVASLAALEAAVEAEQSSFFLDARVRRLWPGAAPLRLELAAPGAAGAAAGAAGSSAVPTRFVVRVVDVACAGRPSVGAFLVPQGRETEWVFSAPAPLAQIATDAGFGRLLVVSFVRGERYGSMEAVQAELAPLIEPLSPAGRRGRFPFLTVGADVGVGERVVRASEASRVSGDVVVEDVLLGRAWARRLVFGTGVRHVVQSEMVLADGTTPDTHQLAFPFHRVMAAATLTWVAERVAAQRVLVLGLGGGALPSWLAWAGSGAVEVETVELDPLVVKLARTWFALPLGPLCRVTVGDGLLRCRTIAAAAAAAGAAGESGGAGDASASAMAPSPGGALQALGWVEKTTDQRLADVLLVDVDAKDLATPLSFPGPGWVEPDGLRALCGAVAPGGAMIMNVACRAEDVFAAIVERVRDAFGRVLVLPGGDDEDVNRVLVAPRSATEWTLAAARAAQARTERGTGAPAGFDFAEALALASS
jgi:spermidine synthase